MTVSNLTSRNDYVGTGLVSVYDFDFPIFVASDLLVTEVDDEGDETTLVLNTDYTVSIDADGTGSITLGAALTDDYGLTIRRVLPLTQATDIRNQGDFYPEAHEKQFDRLVMIAQQQQNELDGCLRAAETDATIGELPSAADRASKFLAFDSDGDPIASDGGIDDSIPVSTFVETVLDDADASAVLTTLGFSAYGKTLIDDADAAAARNTLGATAGLWTSSLLATGAATGNKRLLTVATEKTGTYAVLTSDDVIRGNTDASAFECDLPTAVGNGGKEYWLIYSGTGYANALTIDPDGAETIGGSATTTLNTPGERLHIVSDNANWLILGRYVGTLASWTAWTPTHGLTGGANTPTGFIRRDGDTLYARGDITFGTIFTGGTCSITLPLSLSMDTAKIPGTEANGVTPVLGKIFFHDIGTENNTGILFFSSATTLLGRYLNDTTGGGTNAQGTTAVTTTAPFTWANNDRLSFEFSCPISGWKG